MPRREFFAAILSFPLILGAALIQSLPTIHDRRRGSEFGTKIDFTTDSFAVFERSRFVTAER